MAQLHLSLVAESGQINGCHCFKPLSFGVACHTAIVTETVAIWSKSMTELNMTRTLLFRNITPCRGQACEGQTRIQGPVASPSLGQLPSPLEAGTKQPPSLADAFALWPFLFPLSFRHGWWRQLPRQTRAGFTARKHQLPRCLCSSAGSSPGNTLFFLFM